MPRTQLFVDMLKNVKGYAESTVTVSRPAGTTKRKVARCMSKVLPRCSPEEGWSAVVAQPFDEHLVEGCGAGTSKRGSNRLK